MRQVLTAALRPAAAVAMMAAASPIAASDAAEVDLAAFIECRAADSATYQRFASRLADDPRSVEHALGLTEERTRNPMLEQFHLARPIRVFARDVSRIALTSSGILAVIDMADPHPIARALGIDAVIDTPSKYLGERLVSEKRETSGGVTFRSRITLNVSTVDSHPGRTFAGCNYAIDVE